MAKNFKGFDIKDKNYKTKTVIVKGCENNCELTILSDDKGYVGVVGNRCDRCIK
jgi:hypothetical protein